MKYISINRLIVTTLLTFLMAHSGTVYSSEVTLECKLYIAESMDSDASSNIELKDIELMLSSVRRSGVCVFADGSVADKQFVMVDRIVGDGSTGSNLGFSVYTMENGDSVSAQFSGAWGANGFKGIYTILGGTGQYSGSTGDGTITGTPSPWSTTTVDKIKLNVSTP